MAIVSVSIVRMFEAGKGHSWWITLTNDRGQTMTPMMTRNRANALTEQIEWADFLGLEPTPYYEDGVLITADFILGQFRDDDAPRGPQPPIVR